MLKTEQRNPKSANIDKASTREMLSIMQDENENAMKAVRSALGSIEKAVDVAAEKIKAGGRIIYVGAGTSGRLGILDAAECPPTFGVSPETFVGVIAGGERAVFNAAENKEDVKEDGEKAITDLGVCKNDAIIGISASGGAKFVVGALCEAKKRGAAAISITSNDDTPVAAVSDVKIVVDTGAEVITGSTRLKAGTAQKVILNMISTAVMVKCGYVYENLMINLKPSNEKLKKRVVGIVSELTGEPQDAAEKLLENNQWDIRKAVSEFKGSKT